MRHTLRIAFALLLVCAAFAQDSPRFASESLRDKTSLIPRNPGKYEGGGLLRLRGQLGSTISEETLRVFERKADGAWKTFRDDLVSFEYPDEPLLRIVPIEPGESVPIVGGAVGNADRSFQRAYRIEAGANLPYLTIFVQETDRFDDGICLCGAIVHEQLISADGTLLRFSYLGSGALKKVQALGPKHRAIALEWTHTAITQEAFARIGQSLRLRQPSENTREQWIAKLDAQEPGSAFGPRSKLHDRVAWLEPQMTEAAVRDLLGPPAKVEKDWALFTEETREPDGQRWRFTSRVPFKDGRFVQFDTEWAEANELDPEPGTVRWAETLFGRDRSISIPGLTVEKSTPKPSKKTAKSAADAFLNRAEEREREYWPRWCAAMSELFYAKLGDPRVLARIEATFLELDRNQNGAVEVLIHAPSKRLADLTLARANLLCRSAEEIPDNRLEEFSNLISAAGDKPLEARQVVNNALKSKNPKVRRVAVHAIANAFDTSDALQIRARYLDDPEPLVRRAAAYVSGWYAASAAHLPAIDEHIEKETDPETKQYLQEIAKSIRKRNAKKSL